jgi:beta-lactamase regulating signal transducer with metallopeptidase domain
MTFSLPQVHALTQVFTERMLNTAIEGIVLAAVAWGFLRLTGRQNSRTRFAVWFATLILIAALPFFSYFHIASSHLLSHSAAGLKPQITLSSSWAYFLFAMWAMGATLLLSRVGLGLRRVRNLRRNCAEVDLASLDPAVAGILRNSCSRRVKLCVSDEVAVPAAIGFFRPAIVFPQWLLSQLSPAEMEVIVLHELAHLRRWDDWTNLAQKILKAMFFFHPAVWWIENRLTLEREMACDDMVLAQTGSPTAYASSLISFAEKLHNARGLALAQALVSRVHQLSQRIAQILDGNRPSRTGLWKPVLSVSASLLLLVTGAAPYMPQLVAFENLPAQARSARSAEHAANATPVIYKENNWQGTGARVIPAMEMNGAQQGNFAARAKAIPAAFDTRTTLLPRTLKARPARKPALLHTKSAQQQIPVQRTILILRTTSYDAFGDAWPAVWTLCIWRVDGNSAAERQFESAIVLSWI